MSKLSNPIAALVVVCMLLGPAGSAADREVNEPDNNSATLGNQTSESEPSVAVFGSTVVVAWNDTRDPSSAHISIGYAYSNDGGATFTAAGFLAPPSGYFYVGDPSLAVDRTGHFYISGLVVSPNAPLKVAVSRSSTSNPLAFDSPTLIEGGADASLDKDMIAVDTSGGRFDGRVYVAATEFQNAQPDAPLLVTHSEPTGSLDFATPAALRPQDAINLGAIPAVAPNGDVFVVWGQYVKPDGFDVQSESIHIAKSDDGGDSFHNPDPNDLSPSKIVAEPTPAPDMMYSGGVAPDSHDFPFIAIDQTPPGSPTRGNLYIVYQANPDPSSNDRADVFFTRSVDGGQSWSQPLNIDKGPAVIAGADTTDHDNWQPAIAVSPVDGRITVVFYDRRMDQDNFRITLFRADSTDGGLTWVDAPASSASFAPFTGYDNDATGVPRLGITYMGDYNAAVSTGTGLYVVWTDLRNQCAPPRQASAPCSPPGRPDMDVFALHDLTGSAPAAQPTAASALTTSSRAHPAIATSGVTLATPTAMATPIALAQILQGYQQRYAAGCAPAFESVESALATAKLPVTKVDRNQQLIETGLTKVDSAELKRIVAPSAAATIGDREGRYALTFQVQCLGPGVSAVSVSAIVIVDNPNVGNPLRGLPAPSSGLVEKKQLARLAQTIHAITPVLPIEATPTP